VVVQFIPLLVEQEALEETAAVEMVEVERLGQQKEIMVPLILEAVAVVDHNLMAVEQGDQALL
jgi:hypothetical protein